MLETLLGDHPVTLPWKRGDLGASAFPFRFADVKVPNTAFKRVVRDLEFDVAELALVTFLLAKAHGKPLRLLPAVLTSRFQHPLLIHDAQRGSYPLQDLEKKRVGLRSYSVTTAAWVRGILADDFGVDLSRVTWVTFEDPHVAEFRDPPNVQRAPLGSDITSMLLAGELDAAIVGEAPKNDRLQPLIPDPVGAAAAWRRRTGAVQINHMVVTKSSLSPAARDEVFRLLSEGRKAAGNPEMSPFGLAENRRNLEAAIACVYRQGMIPRPFSVEELFA